MFEVILMESPAGKPSNNLSFSQSVNSVDQRDDETSKKEFHGPGHITNYRVKSGRIAAQ